MIENIRALGHGSFQIIGSHMVYINPWKVAATSFLGDIILISHDHYDHFSPADIARLSGENTRLITNEKVASQIEKAEIIRAWQSVTVDRMTIRAVPAYSPNDLRHAPNDGGLGFIISTNYYDIYYTGDTKIIPEMNQLRPDILILPIDDDGTMTVEEAVEAVNLMRPRWVLPCNWGVTGEGVTLRQAEEFKRLVGGRATVILNT